MPKRTYKELAHARGVTEDVIKKMAREGVNVYDPAAFDEARGKQRHRIAPEAKIDIAELPDDGLQTLESLRKMLLTTNDLNTSKIIKEKAEAYKKLLAAEKEEGAVLSIAEVEDRETKIGAAVKAAFDKMGYDLPGACAGLDEVGILNVYEDLKREALTMLADLTSDFWKERK